ncbi:UDP-N-acetylmuramoyl-L-alanine--D-glutamate ligase [Tissierella sp. Yu-01]|jgi:UDP-N-acetylmuramoylalanine--D-glutamate ligase|uniref:UDP-N-acetylmuramoyl-L-alanine--D-glutamate ligase n=1 Tax=Tissierella sp. Yu-01 TaxID=3035694 RepID=UPI00240E3515|nr:UDP-N-acetylmuramoyl-L-alanine--D-glutamate ligase [Tissierella sp. Yu-01]WFA09630.1 UDP-N-acetylmuramoyl-L-alanine--D-glutamate ligase [Tissierella sp. Yu-01]
MNLINKKVLVFGLGITGVSTIKALHKLGAKISVCDTKTESELNKILIGLKDIPMELHLGSDDFDLNEIDLVIKSPGIPPSSKLIKKAIHDNVEVITDLELAYRISSTENIIAITGTNGKTTCTVLTGEIFKKADFKTHVVGNIGVGILDEIIFTGEEDVFIIEASSFQLENTSVFKPKVGLITNITPDHLDWHGTYEEYINAKFKIFRNQGTKDYMILNYDDKRLRDMKDEIKSKIIWFSIQEKLSKGIYIEDEYIIINDGLNEIKLIKADELKILGKHNLENALGCIGIALAMKVDLNILKDVLRTFKGVEHRLEFVTKKREIYFYNDSKGTNPDASIKAIEAVKSPIILIAGGYDKGTEFDSFIKEFKDKVKALILLGDTKDKLKKAALNNNYTSIYEVNSIKEAVDLSYELGNEGDNVLLSPACASWDMYRNYEERGNDFKNHVLTLME